MNWLDYIDTSTLTQTETEEKLVYVRYLITREQESEVVEGLKAYQNLLENRREYFKQADSPSKVLEGAGRHMATSEDMELA